MRRPEQEIGDMRVPRREIEEAIPGRSPLRTRDLRQLAAVMQNSAPASINMLDSPSLRFGLQICRHSAVAHEWRVLS